LRFFGVTCYSNGRTLFQPHAQVGMRHRRCVQQLLHSLGRLGRAAGGGLLAPEAAVALAAGALDHVAGGLAAAVLAKG
jgi:hypothetical protein